MDDHELDGPVFYMLACRLKGLSVQKAGFDMLTPW
jgi:hypothetical protein